MADIEIDVNPQQRTINASPRIQQQVIPIEIEDSIVAYWGKILGDIDNQTDLKNALATKQDTLVSGTNIKTLNNTSLLGSGNITIDSLPNQSGNSGKFLKTDGTSALWETINIPTITDTYSATSSDGMSGKAVASAISSLQPSNTAVTHTALTKVGDTNKPVYIAADGTATACAYELNKSVPSNAVFTDTTYSQGTGINISGTTINHSNSVTAATAGTSSATSGSTVAVPYVTYDAQGHITASGTHTHTITGFLTSSDVDQTYSGTSNNAQSGIAVKSAIDTAISSTYKAAGSVAFANLPTLGSSYEGYVYNITDSFTTTSDFVEGAGDNYPAGTNVAIVDIGTGGSHNYKYDVLSGVVDLSAYRTSAAQDVIDATYLPLSGGTMTGPINFNGANSRVAGLQLTESGNNLDGGWNWANKDGAGFFLRSSSHSNAGAFGFFARNSSGTTKQLVGNPAGSLTWDGSEVQRASHKAVANGIASLDANTKVPVAQLPVMTGADGVNAGVTGLVPAPAATDNTKFLKGDGTWSNPTAAATWGNITGTLSDQTDLKNQLDSKADLNLSNINPSNTAKSYFANLAMPSDTYDDLTIPVSNTQVVMPADGWIYVRGTSGYIYITNETASGIKTMNQLGSGVEGNIYLPVSKGDIVTLWYSGGTVTIFRFIYSNGSKWEKQ